MYIYYKFLNTNIHIQVEKFNNRKKNDDPSKLLKQLKNSSKKKISFNEKENK